MCSRLPLYWTRVKDPKGDPRMSLHIWCMLVLFLCRSTKEMVVDKTRPARWQSFQMENGQTIVRNPKRHSEGTFTSDLAHVLDKVKAKDFVEWLASTKRQGCHEDLLQLAAED